MTRQAYAGTRPRFLWLAAFSAIGLFACATGDNGNGTGGTNGGGTGGTNGGGVGGTNGGGTGGHGTGGTNGGGVGGTNGGGVGGTNGGGVGGTNGGGGRATGGMTGSTGGMTGSTGGMTGGCANTNMSVINEDASGYVCNNTWGIKGAWFCYTDGSDTSAGNSCKGSDGKGAGAIPWNATAGAMCLAGTMGQMVQGVNKFAGIGFKVNSGPPGSTAAPLTYNASSLVGFAITLVSGPSGIGTNGMVLNLEFPTTTDLDTNSQDAPGVTIPGVAGTAKTYNVLFSDAVLANNISQRHPVDPANLTDVKISFLPDSVAHTFDFCIKSVVPLMAAPPPIAAGPYGPPWTNLLAQAVNGINGYAVQSAPFPIVNGVPVGNPMTMQVNATAGGVGFTYTAGNGFQAPNSGPGSFPAVISGWGPGEAGIQFYGPYKGGKTIGGTNGLTSVKSNWTFTMGTSGDAVYDVWFANSATPTVPPAVELMVWVGNKDKQPIGFGAGTVGPAVTGSDGVARSPYKGTNGTNQTVITYWVPQGTAPAGVSNFDLRPYFNDAVNRNVGLSTGSFLLGVQTGFEVYSGTWTTTDYSITIQ
jgi:hypothetical protein